MNQSSQQLWFLPFFLMFWPRRWWCSKSVTRKTRRRVTPGCCSVAMATAWRPTTNCWSVLGAARRSWTWRISFRWTDALLTSNQVHFCVVTLLLLCVHWNNMWCNSETMTSHLSPTLYPELKRTLHKVSTLKMFLHFVNKTRRFLRALNLCFF